MSIGHIEQAPPLPGSPSRYRLLTIAQVCELVPYTRQHIYRLEAAGKFPRRVKLGENRVAWREVEIIDWIETRERAPLPEMSAD